MRTHLFHALHTFTIHVCLMANLMPSNLTLFMTVYFHIVHGYAATYMHTPHAHASLPFCHHHVVASCYPYFNMPFSDSIGRFSTNMYIPHDSIHIKSQEIDWHPQSDTPGDFTSKVDSFNFITC